MVTKAWEGTGRFLIFLSFTVKTVKNESDYSILGVMWLQRFTQVWSYRIRWWWHQGRLRIMYLQPLWIVEM